MPKRATALIRWWVAFALCWGCSRTPSPAFGELREIQARGGPATDWVGLSAIFEHALAVDRYVCRPSPRQVFFGAQTPGVRIIRGTMPHYGFYHGPMQYVIERKRDGWHVAVVIAVMLPELGGLMQLPDCRLAGQLEGVVECEGKSFSSSDTLDVCPNVGSFSAPLTKHNALVLLGHWSREVETYYNRDARAQGIPADYDFSFELVKSPQAAPTASLIVPLEPSCGRTPYFHSMRSGWSLPIVAHEVGHVLGLLDEYEMLSGILDFYPKTPLAGADRSRMGLSMKEYTVVLPMHHYLILRRYFCPEPSVAAFDVAF